MPWLPPPPSLRSLSPWKGDNAVAATPSVAALLDPPEKWGDYCSGLLRLGSTYDHFCGFTDHRVAISRSPA